MPEIDLKGVCVRVAKKQAFNQQMWGAVVAAAWDWWRRLGLRLDGQAAQLAPPAWLDLLSGHAPRADVVLLRSVMASSPLVITLRPLAHHQIIRGSRPVGIFVCLRT